MRWVWVGKFLPLLSARSADNQRSFVEAKLARCVHYVERHRVILVPTEEGESSPGPSGGKTVSLFDVKNLMQVSCSSASAMRQRRKLRTDSELAAQPLGGAEPEEGFGGAKVLRGVRAWHVYGCAASGGVATPGRTWKRHKTHERSR